MSKNFQNSETQLKMPYLNGHALKSHLKTHFGYLKRIFGKWENFLRKQSTADNASAYKVPTPLIHFWHKGLPKEEQIEKPQKFKYF